ncbi:TIGR04086 family membrane protein [Anaerovorax odorimutans]|uniref:TIGR04086 family membrane protein n=1 Tax=Anaerovorax odorimutans TaxID=109327 RepID=UPI00040A1C8A|nr:TIGR04086 family membrane protein [Anaerovorax odorimutans]
MEKALKNIKGLVYSLIFFVLLTLLFNLIVKFGSLPERWSNIYVLISLCLSCMFIGLYMGYYIKKKGFFYGMGYSVILLLVIVGMLTTVFNTTIELGLFHLRYIICVLFGSIGGTIGVNLRS